ncbi:probable enoyl-CoA hydratase, mitochondrial [Schistocerca gregaria]|uniref:probable enoyl-CoA hydratase, mitochondrial n=1 Tax=Schistocerca gregaria TaxID=7010 RepID=UPI00211E7F6A|nr:probable enoyl-CoA hydratase, mitochondrial [Schistocerca gregaria]
MFQISRSFCSTKRTPIIKCPNSRRSYVEQHSYKYIIFEKKKNTGLITLNRPKELNVLNQDLVKELHQALNHCQDAPDIGAIVITGSKKAFSAGADIKSMSLSATPLEAHSFYHFQKWEEICKIRKPIIAAINGFALGGGFELAMCCDILLAGNNAKFGQPEVKLGTIPGLGGTQRLARALGKSKTMEMCMTGELIDAATAEKYGLVSRIVAEDELLGEALALGEKIASFSQPIVAMAKECVNRAYETSLSEGLLFERRQFLSTFSTQDRKEGMDAFLSKREPVWSNK